MCQTLKGRPTLLWANLTRGAALERAYGIVEGSKASKGKTP
jgi:hypothetical protein